MILRTSKVCSPASSPSARVCSLVPDIDSRSASPPSILTVTAGNTEKSRSLVPSMTCMPVPRKRNANPVFVHSSAVIFSSGLTRPKNNVLSVVSVMRSDTAVSGAEEDSVVGAEEGSSGVDDAESGVDNAVFDALACDDPLPASPHPAARMSAPESRPKPTVRRIALSLIKDILDTLPSHVQPTMPLRSIPCTNLRWVNRKRISSGSTAIMATVFTSMSVA